MSDHVIHIGIVSGGTRGDVQPSVILGKGLKKLKYRVTILAGTNFEPLIISEGLEFKDLGVDVRMMMESETGRAWTRSNNFTQLFQMKKLFNEYSTPMVENVASSLSEFDVIISGLTTFGLAAVVAKARKIPLFHLLFQPMYPSKDGRVNPAPVLSKSHSWINRLSFTIMLRGLWYVHGEGINAIAESLHIPKFRYKDFEYAWLNTPTLQAASAELFPPAEDYPPQVHVTGFLFKKQDENWEPSSELLEFLRAGEPPVYIGFGSMTGHEKEDIIMIENALQGKRAILNTGWSGLHNDNLPDSMFLVDDVPHDWLFPQMTTVVHHGGAGTVAAGLRAGVPMIIVTHLGDQFHYGRRIHELGIGPKPIPRRNLSAVRLQDRIEQIFSNDSYTHNSQQMSKKIQQEDGLDNILAVLEEYLRASE